MNKKGFTLAELMGVIVILGILLLLVVPNVIKNIKNAKQDAYNTQITNIKMALQNWKENNIGLLPEQGETIYLTIGQLKKDNYLDDDLKDPLTGKMISNDMLLTITNNNGYQYAVLTNTGTLTDNYDFQTPFLSFDNGDVEILNIGDVYIVPIVRLNKSDGTSEILVNVDPIISGSGNSISTTYAGVYQVRYNYTYGGVAISSVHNVIIRDNSDDSQYTIILEPDTTLYPNGTAVYFNPNTGLKCTSAEATANINSSTSSPTGIKNGCMRWYTFNDKANETEVRLLLDHNTTPVVAWNSSNVTFHDPIDALNALNSDILGWKKSIRQTARFITADEIARITNAAAELRWESSLPYVPNNQTPVIGTNSWSYFFDGKKTGNDYWKEIYSRNGIVNDYHWLYDYTFGGASGCLTPDDNRYTLGSNDYYIYGYWTSSPITGYNSMWVVYSYGEILEANSMSSSYGIRPVITIAKALIK